MVDVPFIGIEAYTEDCTIKTRCKAVADRALAFKL